MTNLSSSDMARTEVFATARSSDIDAPETIFNQHKECKS
ncbi:hypothetical protein [Falsiruegeria mediterranea]